MKTPLAILVLVTLFAAAAQAQSSAWTSYLHGAARDELDEAVQAVEAEWAGATREFRALYDAIEERYVAARSDALRSSAYAELLGEILREPDAAQPTESHSARRRIALVLGEEAPLPGTRNFAVARDWLRALARGEGFPVDGFDSLLRLFEDAVLSGLSPLEARRFSESLSVPTAGLPDDLNADDALRQRFAMWELIVLAAEDDQRVQMLREVERATIDVASAGARETAAEFREIRLEREQVLDLLARFPIAADVLSLVSPLVFGDARRLSESPAVLDFATLLVAVARADSRASVDVYRRRGDAAFFVDTVQSLLSSASDLQRYAAARAMGLSRAELDHAAARLYRVRREAARLSESAQDISAVTGASDPDSAFSRFLEAGAAHVSDAAPWATGDRSRSGDSFRWTMLPIVSHPYAQFMLATVPELSETRTMVDDFVSGVYEGTIRSLTLDSESISAVVLGDGVQPLSRVYAASSSATAAELYASFAAVAQGVEQLSPDFRVPYTAGLTLAGYWSHMHGLHVAVIADEPTDREGIARLVRARVDAWFALARSVDTDQEELSLTLRGLLALRRVLHDELLLVLSAAGVPSLAVYEPRLPVVLSLLDDVAGFIADPLVVRARLAELYEAPEGDATNDLIAADLARLLTRLRDVEIADRRVLRRLAGSGEI